MAYFQGRTVSFREGISLYYHLYLSTSKSLKKTCKLSVSTPAPTKCWEIPTFLPGFSPCPPPSCEPLVNGPSEACHPSRHRSRHPNSVGEGRSQILNHSLFFSVPKKNEDEDNKNYLVWNGLTENTPKMMWISIAFFDHLIFGMALKKKKQTSLKVEGKDYLQQKRRRGIYNTHHTGFPRVFRTLWCRRVVGPCRDVRTSATHPGRAKNWSNVKNTPEVTPKLLNFHFGHVQDPRKEKKQKHGTLRKLACFLSGKNI